MIKRFIFIILGLFILPSSVFANGLLDGLISYYELEETGFNYADSHGSRPFTTGTATTQTTGKINYGQEFDGTTDYLEAGGGSWGTIGTISMWLNPDDDTDKNIWGDDSSSGIQMYFDGGGGLNLYDVGNNKLLAVGAGAVNTGSWQHVVFVADGASSAVYVNGVSVTPTTNTLTGQLTTTGNIHLGTRYSQDKKFDGKIDEVGVWDKALSASEVSELYNSGSGLAYSSFTNPPNGLLEGLESYYALEETTGSTFADSSSNGLDASTETGSPSLGQTGINGNAISFTDDRIAYNYGAYGSGGEDIINSTNSVLSFSYWVKPASNSQTGCNIVLGQTHTPSGRIAMASCQGYTTSDNNGNNVIGLSEATAWLATTSTYNTNNWNHVVMTWNYNTGYFKQYLNGNLIKTDSSSLYSTTQTEDIKFQIGGYLPSRMIDSAVIDEVALWRKELTSDDVTTLYNSGSGLFYSSFTNPAPNDLLNNLQAYYELEETGLNYADQTGSWDITQSQTSDPPAQTTGILNYGQAFRKSTTDDLVVPHNMLYNNINADGNMTISAWVKGTNTGTNTIFSAFAGSASFQNAGGLNFFIEGSQVMVGGNDCSYGGLWYNTKIGSTINDGNWHHVMVTYSDYNTQNVWIDGSYAGTSSNPYCLPSSASSSYNNGASSTFQKFGSNPANGGHSAQWSDYDLDEVAFWNTTLNSTHATALYNGGSALAYSSFGTGAPANTDPTITPITDQVMFEDTRLNVTSAFTVNDAEDLPSDLTLSYSSSNTALLNSTGSITFNKNGVTGLTDMLQITPNADAYGATNVTVTVTDQNSGTASSTFLLTVTNVNDAPTISTIPDVSTLRGNTNIINFTVADIDNLYTELDYGLAYNTYLNPAFNPITDFSFYNGTNQTLTLTASSSYYGEQLYYVNVSDPAGAFALANFTYRVSCNSTTATATTISNTYTMENSCYSESFNYNTNTDIYNYTYDDFANSVDSVVVKAFKTTGNQNVYLGEQTSSLTADTISFDFSATNPSDNLRFEVYVYDANRTFSGTNNYYYRTYDVDQGVNFATYFSDADGLLYGTLLLLLFLTIGVASQSATLTIVLSIVGLFIASKLVLKIDNTFLWIAGVVGLALLWLIAKLRVD